MKEGIGFDIIPADIVEEYGIADVQSTYEVAVSQSKQEGKSIEQIAAYTVPVFFEVTKVLAGMERDGIKIDRQALQPC